MICEAFVCKHGATCINEHICELFCCPRYVEARQDACKLCMYDVACHRPKGKVKEIYTKRIVKRECER